MSLSLDRLIDTVAMWLLQERLLALEAWLSIDFSLLGVLTGLHELRGLLIIRCCLNI